MSSTSTDTWIPLFGNPSTWNGENVYINSTVTVNSVFNMYNCKIKMGPNGHIVVTSGGHFVCSSNQFFACSTWQGITIEGTAEVDFFLNQIEDAEKAIEIISEDADISIGFNIFNRNVIGIYADQVVSNALVVSNTFDCTSDTYAGSYSKAGIQLFKSTLTVGVPQATSPFGRNNFRFQRRGIDCQESSVLQLYHADFRCCFEEGVHSNQGTVNLLESQNPNGGYFKNSFIHNLADVISVGTNLNVRNSYFDGCLTSNIFSDNNNLAQFVSITNDSIVITQNDNFAPTKTGIIVERSTATSSGIHNNIEDNLIRILPFATANKRHAIRVEGFAGTADEMLIQRNAITVGKGGSNPAAASQYTSTFVDINMRSSGGYSVLRNAILVQNEENINYSNRWGFYIHGWESPSNFNFLLENHVIGSNDNFDFGCCGFHFNESGPWTMCFNETNYTLRGFHINNYCGGSVFARNFLGDHRTSPIVNPGINSITAALLMENNSQMGLQLCRQNMWTIADYSPNRGAWHKDVNDYFLSRFDVDPLQLGTVPNPVFPGSGWFVGTPGGCSSTSGPEECYTASGYKDSLDQHEKEILESNWGFINTPGTAIDWEQKRQLMGKLLAYPVLKEFYPEAQTFFEQNIEQSAGKFAQFNQALHESMLLPEDLSGNLNESQLQVQSLLATLSAYDSAILDSAQFVSANTEFFAGRRVVLQELKQSMSDQEQVIEAINTWRAPRLESCIALQQALPSEQLYEQNQKFLCGLDIKNALSQPFTDSDYEILRDIAQQCPIEAGLTIDRAKGMLPNSDALASWSDIPEENNCFQGTEMRVKSQTSNTGLLVLPNPTNSFLEVRFPTVFSGTIQVISPSGKSEITLVGLEKQTSVILQTAKLHAGVYYLLATPSSGTRFLTRFTVLK